MKRRFPAYALVGTVIAAVALASCQDMAIVYYNQGIDAIENGDTAAAVEYFEKSVQERYSDPDAHLNLGVALLGVGEHERALREFEIASLSYPEDPELHLNMAEAYQALGRYNEARSEYEYALRRDPLLVEALSGYAGLLLDAGEFEAAEELLTAAVSERQSYWQAHLYLGWLYVWTGSRQRGHPLLPACAALQPQLAGSDAGAGRSGAAPRAL